MELQNIKFALSRTKLRSPVVWARHRGITKQDVFIASYPRSGSTLLRFLLLEALSGEPSTFPSVNRLIPRAGIETPFRLADGGSIHATHEAYRREYQRTVYLVRDVRDVMLSEHAFQTGLGLVELDLEDYLPQFLEGRLSRYGSWQKHVGSWTQQSKVTEGILVVKFEEMRRNTEETIRRITNFLGAPVSDEAIRSAIRNNSTERMRAKELETPQRVSKRGRFVRAGSAGGWREALTLEQVRMIESRTWKELACLGYPLQEQQLSAQSR
jgi:hypothetical protein